MLNHLSYANFRKYFKMKRQQIIFVFQGEIQFFGEVQNECVNEQSAKM